MREYLIRAWHRALPYRNPRKATVRITSHRGPTPLPRVALPTGASSSGVLTNPREIPPPLHREDNPARCRGQRRAPGVPLRHHASIEPYLRPYPLFRQRYPGAGQSPAARGCQPYGHGCLQQPRDRGRQGDPGEGHHPGAESNGLTGSGLARTYANLGVIEIGGQATPRRPSMRSFERSRRTRRWKPDPPVSTPEVLQVFNQAKRKAGQGVASVRRPRPRRRLRRPPSRVTSSTCRPQSSSRTPTFRFSSPPPTPRSRA